MGDLITTMPSMAGTGALETSLDYLAGRSQNDLKDKEMMDRFNSILNLEKGDKDNILYAIDGLIKAARLKSI